MNTYFVRTFGCQMNKHDSEKVSGMLEAEGLRGVDSARDADVVVFMTCCVRENADERLKGQVASLKSLKAQKPGQIIAVGGCIGQRDGATLQEALPHVDVVFGTHNLAHLPQLIEQASLEKAPVAEVLESSVDFTNDLPSTREHPWHAWVPITVGCDNFCTYCIVPYVRGREKSRPLADVASEVERLVSEGVREITLLGQNVNSYGRDLYGEPRFAHLLREVGATDIDRIRFATSHPKDLSDDTIEALANTPSVMPYLHLPVQSGSDRILKAMNRVYTSTDYLSLVDRLREAIPHIALSTDVIVGFPGETEADFDDTMRVVEATHVMQAFTFIYSPREKTPAAKMADQISPKEVVQKRFDRLVDLVQKSAFIEAQPLVGTTQEVLIEGVSKRDDAVLVGRCPSNRVVHTPIPEGYSADDLAGTMVKTRITDAHTWYLEGTVSEELG